MTPYEILERARAARFRPAENPEDLFGEFRSLAHHTFEGGELWSDWAPLISKMGEGDLERLAESTGDAWVVVEKILEGEERLPESGRCAGTTGYDALLRVLKHEF